MEPVETTLPRRLVEAYSVEAAGLLPYFAFSWQSGSLQAWRTRNGDWVEDRSTLPAPTSSFAAPSLLRRDLSNTVGDASLAWLGDEALHCWDVEGEAVHTYSPPPGRQISAPLWISGYLHWVENEPTSTDGVTQFFHWRSRANFATPILVHTLAVPLVTPVEWDGGSSISSAGTRLYLQKPWLDSVNMEEVGNHGTSWDLLAQDALHQALDAELDLSAFPLLGLPLGSQSLGTSNGRLESRNGTLASGWQSAWPTTSPWEVQFSLSVGLDSNGRDALLYGRQGSDRFAIRGPVTSPGSEPLARFQANPHPASSRLPDALFPED